MMTNRVPNYTPPLSPAERTPEFDLETLPDLAVREATERLRQAKRYVQKHPAQGVGAAFCIGMLLGWYFKRR